ncbi:hypothetical protein ACLOJK_036483, partial [Asimina triloba]
CGGIAGCRRRRRPGERCDGGRGIRADVVGNQSEAEMQAEMSVDGQCYGANG